MIYTLNTSAFSMLPPKFRKQSKILLSLLKSQDEYGTLGGLRNSYIIHTFE